MCQHPWPESSAGWWSAPQRPQKATLSLPEPTEERTSCMGTACSDPIDFQCVPGEHAEAQGGKSASSPELGQENLHHSHHVHVHVQREGGLGGSRGFNVVNLQESVSARHSQSPGAGRAASTHWGWGVVALPERCQHPTAPYHDAAPAGAVEGVGAHWGSVLVLDVQRGVGTLWHVQQEVQDGVERGSAGACSGTESKNSPGQQGQREQTARAQRQGRAQPCSSFHSKPSAELPSQQVSSPSLPSGAGRAWCRGEGRGRGRRHSCPPSLSRACDSRVRSAVLTQPGLHRVDDMREAVGAQEEARGLFVKAWRHS